MAVLLEHDAKRVLAAAGVPVPKGVVCGSPEEVVAAVQLLGPCVIKAVIPTGRKGKGGGVLTAASATEASDAATSLLGHSIHGFSVECVLVEEMVSIASEHFVSVVLDGSAKTWRLIFDMRGGVDVESWLAPASISLTLPPDGRVRAFHIRNFLRKAGASGPALRALASTVATLCRTAIISDATLLEVNPLVHTESGKLCALGVMLAIDDRALARHPDLAELAIGGVEQVGRPLTAVESAMKALNESFPTVGEIRFSEFPDGDIGVMVMGGGAGLVVLDALDACGGKPANFFDMTGGQVEEKIYCATRELLRISRLRALFIGGNIGAFAPVPIRLRGIVRALKESPRDLRRFPVVIRLAGPGDDEALSIVAEVPEVVYVRDNFTLEGAVELLMDRLKMTQ